jgi:hypothetical protein
VFIGVRGQVHEYSCSSVSVGWRDDLFGMRRSHTLKFTSHQADGRNRHVDYSWLCFRNILCQCWSKLTSTPSEASGQIVSSTEWKNSDRWPLVERYLIWTKRKLLHITSSMTPCKFHCIPSLVIQTTVSGKIYNFSLTLVTDTCWKPQTHYYMENG